MIPHSGVFVYDIELTLAVVSALFLVFPAGVYYAVYENIEAVAFNALLAVDLDNVADVFPVFVVGHTDSTGKRFVVASFIDLSFEVSGEAIIIPVISSHSYPFNRTKYEHSLS